MTVSTTSTTSTRHSCYLNQVFSSADSFKETVDKMKSLISETIEKEKSLKNVKYIACRGVSGASIASPLSYLLGMGLIVVRKKNDNSHASYDVEGAPIDQFQYVIVDDLICSGTTIRTINNDIMNFTRERGFCKGIFLYESFKFFQDLDAYNKRNDGQ